MPVLWVLDLPYFDCLYMAIFVAFAVKKFLCMVVVIASGGLNPTIYHGFEQILEDNGSPAFDICLSYGYVVSSILIVYTRIFLLSLQLTDFRAWLC